VFALRQRPDGTLAGEYSGTSSNTCSGKGTVTFTRTGDVDVDSLPDPATLPPRVVSPAERYMANTAAREPSRTGSHNCRVTTQSLPTAYAPAIGA
jgi:serine/threonine-protein kinase